VSSHPARQLGFTLIESLVILAIVAILLAMAVPNFSGFISRYQLTTASNDFLSGITTTRNEAMKRGRRVDMIPASGNDWTSGWIVFVDRNNNQQVDSGAGDDIVMRHEAIPSSITISGTTDSCTTASGNPAFKSGGKSFIAYLGTGYPNNSTVPGGIMLSHGGNSRIVCLNFIGRPRVVGGN
jgi:type IV fimbrial biogenesis protein FimT